MSLVYQKRNTRNYFSSKRLKISYIKQVKSALFIVGFYSIKIRKSLKTIILAFSVLTMVSSNVEGVVGHEKKYYWNRGKPALSK